MKKVLLPLILSATIIASTQLASAYSVDTSFKSLFKDPSSTNTSVLTVAFQEDGKILMGGVFETYDKTPTRHIVRIHPDGTRDTTFKVGTGFHGLNPVYKIVPLPKGKILVAGAFTVYNG